MCSDLGAEDVAVIIAGTNDIDCKQTSGLVRSLKRRLQELGGTNIVLFSVPHRYDLPFTSPVNAAVKKANEEIHKVCKYFENVSFVDISHIGCRFHTSHGLHLNMFGKMYVVDKILDCVRRVGRKFGTIVSKQPISLPSLKMVLF